MPPAAPLVDPVKASSVCTLADAPPLLATVHGMSDGAPRGFFEQLSSVSAKFVKWVQDHEEEIRAFGIWGTVNTACDEARLYAPFHRETWLEIVEAVRAGEKAGNLDCEAIITSAYGPNGIGFEALRQELLDAPLLAERQREAGEVLDSLADSRNYVAVCGALPLVEYVMSRTTDKWKDPREHLKTLERRLHEEDADEEFAELILEISAVEMLLKEIPAIWKSGRHRLGAIVDDLNRHQALHGSGVGWGDSTNATRAVLLLAAAARVVDLLSKQPAAATAGA
jgi:hypothetical protein